MPRVIVALVLLLQTVAFGCVTRLREAPWITVKSARFEIFSTLSVEETKALATELERFHSLIYAVTNAPKVESSVPTRIYALARRSQYSQLGPAGTAGFFNTGLRYNLIVLADYSPTLGASEVILHEYVHFVLRNGKNPPYPIWYDEGLAEFFSTVVRHKNALVIGAIPKARIPAFQRLEWVPIERIIAARSYDDLPQDDRGMLYPESWALVHYLALDRESESPSITTGLSRYLELLEAGTPTDDAYHTAFGELPGRSGQKIKGLLKGGDMKVIGIPIAKIDYDRSEPAIRTPDVGEIAVHLGQLQLYNGDGEKAEQEFRTAVDHDPKDPHAQAGIGDALKIQSRFEEAEPYFKRAVELDSRDPMNHLDLGEFYLSRSGAKAESIDALKADLEEARWSFGKALELDADNPEALVELGTTYLAPGQDPKIALGYFQKAFDFVPTWPQILSLIAEANLALGDEVVARKFLMRKLAVSGEGEPESAIEKALGEIRKRRSEAAEKVGVGSQASNRP